VLLIIRDLQHVQLPADCNEDFGYMFVKLDNDLTLFYGAMLAMSEDASLLGEGKNWKHLAGSTSRQWRYGILSVWQFRHFVPSL
jgi:hypothetical protein